MPSRRRSTCQSHAQRKRETSRRSSPPAAATPSAPGLRTALNPRTQRQAQERHALQWNKAAEGELVRRGHDSAYAPAFDTPRHPIYALHTNSPRFANTRPVQRRHNCAFAPNVRHVDRSTSRSHAKGRRKTVRPSSPPAAPAPPAPCIRIALDSRIPRQARLRRIAVERGSRARTSTSLA